MNLGNTTKKYYFSSVYIIFIHKKLWFSSMENYFHYINNKYPHHIFYEWILFVLISYFCHFKFTRSQFKNVSERAINPNKLRFGLTLAKNDLFVVKIILLILFTNASFIKILETLNVKISKHN